MNSLSPTVKEKSIDKELMGNKYKNLKDYFMNETLKESSTLRNF